MRLAFAGRHTDLGSEYTSDEFRTEIHRLGMRQSMGRVGSCYDNVAAESWFALFKAEIGTIVRETREAARADVFRYIEVEYNRSRHRRHPGHGYVTTLETRSLLRQNLAPAASTPRGELHVAGKMAPTSSAVMSRPREGASSLPSQRSSCGKSDSIFVRAAPRASALLPPQSASYWRSRSASTS